MEERDPHIDNIFKTLDVAWDGFMGFIEIFEESENGNMSYLGRLACENARYSLGKIRQAVQEKVGEIKIEWKNEKGGFLDQGDINRVIFQPAMGVEKDRVSNIANSIFDTLETDLIGMRAFVEALEGTYSGESNITKVGRLACENVRHTFYTIYEVVQTAVGEIGIEWTDKDSAFHNSGEIEGLSFKPASN